MDESSSVEVTNNSTKRAFRLWSIPAGMALTLMIAFVLVGSAGARTARVAVAPSNTAAPTITGAAQAGQTLTAATGTWSGTAPLTYSYGWLRCNSSGGGCKNIGGATGTTYVLASPDVNHTLRVTVTATNADGANSATSAATAVTVGGAVPVNTAVPTISGTTSVGQVLTATTGTWTGTAPITYTYRWQRCDASGAHCANIGGATQPAYTLVNPDVANTVRVEVTATNAGGPNSAVSTPTAVVAAATTTTTATTTTPGCTTSGGTVPIADVTSPAHLSIDQFQVTPSTVTYGTRSLTARFHVSACGGSVQGALVYVTAVPYAMFNIPNEQATGADGWATLNFTALSGFPVSKHQQLLVMFVRARKSGEDILGGISARRLVSFKVTRG